MWLFTIYGFFSVVCARSNKGKGVIDEDTVMIRARDRQHLVELKAKYDTGDKWKILDTPEADYPYRVIISIFKFSSFLQEMGEEINYDNFKSAVSKSGSTSKGLGRYLDQLVKVWSIMRGR